MAPALTINTNSRRCVVPLDEVKQLVRKLRRLDAPMHPGAPSLAVLLQAAIEEDVAISELDLLPREEDAARHVLHGLAVESPPLPGGLQCLWDGLRFDGWDAEAI